MKLRFLENNRHIYRLLGKKRCERWKRAPVAKSESELPLKSSDRTKMATKLGLDVETGFYIELLFLTEQTNKTTKYSSVDVGVKFCQ